MPSPFPGMDPFVEKNPIFHELHTQFLAEAQAQLQTQIRPKYVAKLERYLSEGSVWELEIGYGTLHRKEPDIAIVEGASNGNKVAPSGAVAEATAIKIEELDSDELELRKQRRIVIYVQARPRLAVTSIELLSPSNKQPGTIGRERYLEKRASTLHGGLNWVEIDLLRGGQRPPINVPISNSHDYLAYVAQAITNGWRHQVYGWRLRDPLPKLPIPLLDDDRATLDLDACFASAFVRTAADDEAEYDQPPPLPALNADDAAWVDDLLHQRGLR